LFLALAALAVAPLAVQSYTNPIVIKGYKTFDAKTGEAFAVKGIDYYPRPNTGDLDVNNLDFFTDDMQAVWEPDIEYLAEAGANAVRLYAVDPSQSHDAFMCALRAKGMYALVDLGASCENCSITVDEYPACYPSALKTRGEQIIAEFAQYDNVLAFSAGNEVNNIVDDAWTNAPCQKKFIRDMRSFIGSCASFRNVPVGVVMADPDTTNNNREVNSKYYNCRTDSTDEYENAEWYGLNTYQYCDADVTELASSGGFEKLLTDFSAYDLTIPVLLTEFGCVNPSFPTVDGYEAQRTWLQAGWLFDSTFRDVFAGGFAFEYSTENANAGDASPYPFSTYGAQNYGLGYFSPEDCDHESVACVYNPMPNFDNLAEQYNATDISGESAMADFTVASDRTSFPACPDGFAALADVTWEADSVDSLTCPATAQQYECPNQETSGNWASDAGSSSAASTSSKATAEAESDGSSTTSSGSGTAKGSSSAASSIMTRSLTLAAVPSDDRIMKLSVCLAVFTLALSLSETEGYTNPIAIKGYRMFDNKTGASFAVKGIDYYPRPNTGELDVNNHDFFTDDNEAIWKGDIEYLAQAGANAVRLYAVDPSKSHDKFMCALRAKGMYALVDLAARYFTRSPGCLLDAYPTCYPAALKTRGEMIILAFAKYDNVLAFSAGNEVNNEVTDATVNAPCQKKFLRDMRAFIGSCSSLRQIPVGVVVADPDLTKNNRELNAKYYNCRTNADDKYENAEWYGLNAYQYCDNTVTDVANAGGFQQLRTNFEQYSMTIPVMLTEFGCLNEGFPAVNGYEAQRTWRQAAWLYSTAFRQVFSGGFAFEYSTENANSKGANSAYPFTTYGAQNYGLGYFSPENCTHDTVPCVYNPMPNFNNLATQFNSTNVTGESAMGAFTVEAARSTLPVCPTDFATLSSVTWAADSTTSLSCPKAVQAYTCANQVSSGLWATGSSSGTVGTTSSSSGSTPTPTPTTASTAVSGSRSTRKLSVVAVSLSLLSAIMSVLS
ncbi:hypothetical protein BBJ28_00014066, partial [Nothophytophthora sp. Chile5]